MTFNDSFTFSWTKTDILLRIVPLVFCWLIKIFLRNFVSEDCSERFAYYEGKTESHFSLSKVLSSFVWVLTYEKPFNEGTFPIL